MKPKHILILSALAVVVCLVFTVIVVLIIGRVSPISPATAVAPDPTSTPTVLTFMGEGDDFIMFDNATPGLAAFFIKHTGNHFFSVTLNDSGGRFLALLANEIGAYEGESVERLERGGYVLEIKADGRWLVVIGLPE